MQIDVQGSAGKPVPSGLQLIPPSSETQTPPVWLRLFLSMAVHCGISCRIAVAAYIRPATAGSKMTS